MQSATGVPPAQIFLDALGATAGKLLLLVIIGAQLFRGMASVTANSRMTYAITRRGVALLTRLAHGQPAHSHSGRGRVAGGAGSVGAVVITILFMLPQVSPVTWESFNYAPIAVLVVLGFAAAWWFASPATASSTRTTNAPAPARSPARSLRNR